MAFVSFNAMRTFRYKSGNCEVKFTVSVTSRVTSSEVEVTIVEPDGCSFSIVLMPHTVWKEVNDWIEDEIKRHAEV